MILKCNVQNYYLYYSCCVTVLTNQALSFCLAETLYTFTAVSQALITTVAPFVIEDYLCTNTRRCSICLSRSGSFHLANVLWSHPCCPECHNAFLWRGRSCSPYGGTHSLYVFMGTCYSVTLLL